MGAESAYSKIAGAMSAAGAAGAGSTGRIRRCLVVSTDPLTIDVAGIRASGDMLRINYMMKPNTRKEKLKLTEPLGSYTISATDSDGDTTSAVSVSDGSMAYKTELQEYWLEPDDEVLVWSEDDQRFYILCKVVTV